LDWIDWSLHQVWDKYLYEIWRYWWRVWYL